jgi:hypothetical protein
VQMQYDARNNSNISILPHGSYFTNLFLSFSNY